MDSDLQSRIGAYDASGNVIGWTPEMVGARMIEAFDVLRRLPADRGPKKFGNGWPAMMKEWSDLLDPDAWKNAMAEAEARTRRGLVPTREEISLSEEALAWPMLYLADSPLHADALQTWARCLASGYSIRGILAARSKKAKALAEAMTKTQNDHNHARRMQIAARVAKWANKRLKAASGDVERCKAIKINADIRFRREIDAADAWDKTITPAQAMPGKIRTEKTLERYRKAACVIVCERLRSLETG